jgi:hypothetical protein
VTSRDELEENQAKHRLGTHPVQTRAWIWPSHQRPGEEEARASYLTTTDPTTSPRASTHSVANTIAVDRWPKASTQETPKSEAPDSVNLHLTSPSPAPGQKTARWIRTRRTLFHISPAAATKQTPSRYEPQKGLNLHRQARKHGFPHSRLGDHRRRRGSSL